jgi:ferredoxin--NADP+ reductase
LKILAKRIIGEYNSVRIFEIYIFSPEIARTAKPGQFIVVMVNERGERIPLTIVETDEDKGSLRVIFQEIGFTTRLLAKINPGESLYAVLGPLGREAQIGEEYKNLVLVGGGVGIAEIYPVLREARQIEDRYIITILGARNEGLLILRDQIRKLCDELICTTDDGSYGMKGNALDALKELLEKREVDFVYAVGPLKMMEAISNYTRQFNIKTVVCLNPIMVDGTGMCGSCRVTIAGEIKFACIDGPDFDGHQVDWQELSQRLRMYEKQERQILGGLDKNERSS